MKKKVCAAQKPVDICPPDCAEVVKIPDEGYKSKSPDLPAISKAIYGYLYNCKEMQWAVQLAAAGQPIKWTCPNTEKKYREAWWPCVSPIFEEMCRAAAEAVQGKGNAFARLDECFKAIAHRGEKLSNPVAQKIVEWQRENMGCQLNVKQFARDHRFHWQTVKRYADLLEIPTRVMRGRPRNR